MKPATINFVIFQLGWFACVLGGDLVALLCVLAALAIHHRYVLSTPFEYLSIVLISAAGIAWDSLLAAANILVFPQSTATGLPLWLILLWLLFATTFHHCFAWMQKYLLPSTLAGAVFGPLSYLAGSRLGEAEIAEPVMQSLLIMALGWAVIFPAGLILAQKVGQKGLA